MLEAYRPVPAPVPPPPVPFSDTPADAVPGYRPVPGGITDGAEDGPETAANVFPFFPFSDRRRRRLFDALSRMLRGEDASGRLFAACVLRRRPLGNFAPLAPRGATISRPASPQHPRLSRPAGGAA
jgi:hypothetical protein